jgi:trans-aconitate 2-methyltransferase
VTRDWDAAAYDRVSGVQEAWAREVLARLPLRGDERVLDAGCGSGRVTRLLLERLPRGHVVAVDSSEAMVEKARAALGGRATVLKSDLAELVLDEPVDAAFSNSVFHWVSDHDRLFSRLHAAMRAGAPLVAQCGGRGNLAGFLAAADRVSRAKAWSRWFHEWRQPRNLASAEETAARLERAGFTDVSCWLDAAPVTPDEPEVFVTVVCLRPHLDRVPDEHVPDFVRDVLEERGDPLVLDYVRLNIDARRNSKLGRGEHL